MDGFWKGHETLLRVLSTPVWQSRSWLLDCHGDGKDRRYIGELASYFGIADRVHICGQTRDIKNVWKESHALLLPTKAEGFSLAVLEAMMCGRPVVCSDVGDLGDVVRNGETGFLAENCSPKAFAFAMESFWKSRLLWRELGLRAHNTACALNNQKPAAKLLDVLTSAVRNKNNSENPHKNKRSKQRST